MKPGQGSEFSVRLDRAPCGRWAAIQVVNGVADATLFHRIEDAVLHMSKLCYLHADLLATAPGVWDAWTPPKPEGK